MAVKEKLKFAVLGMSEGNGHPYSWSAIFNGYDKVEMAKCPFPVIPDYLSKESWPDARIHEAEVTHIWTQDKQISEAIAKACFIENQVDVAEAVIGAVDGILLARDDPENHMEMAKPFLQAGLPVFIDKPLASSVEEAEAIFELQQYKNQVFTCSALRYDKGLTLSTSEKEALGNIIHVEATVPKSWQKYAVHTIEQVVTSLSERGAIKQISAHKSGPIVKGYVKWEQLSAQFTTYGDYTCPLGVTYYGEKKMLVKQHKDTFNTFKKSLEAFTRSVQTGVQPIPRAETLEIVQIIEEVNHEA